MPYKIVPTKVCSECGRVLESRTDHYCDGCGIQTDQKDYDVHVRLSFLMENSEEHKEEMVFHSLECLQKNHQKIDLAGVRTISIDFICPNMFKRILEILSAHP